MEMFQSEPGIGVGFGTAALGGACFEVVRTALQVGFRKFDTAEADHWYDQDAVGAALRSFFASDPEDGSGGASCPVTCEKQDLRISTKIPPWELTSVSNIRRRAAESRETLVGFCGPSAAGPGDTPFPLDVYYIHAPECWEGWHPRCEGVGATLSLREAWLGMEAVVGLDRNARRIGLSNVSPRELLDVIRFVEERRHSATRHYPPPRMPDVLQAHADPLDPASELRAICKEHGIEFVSYSTLGTQHVMRDRRAINPVLENPHILTLADRYQRSTAEVVLSWALQRGMSVIPRSGNEHHIRELSNLLTDPPFLSSVDLSTIDSLSLN